MAIIRRLSICLCLSIALSAQSATEPKAVAEAAHVRFYSDELMNLHHTLYAAAWARRPEAGTLKALAGKLPAPLGAPMTAAERAAWQSSIDYYDRNVAPRDLLFGRGMEALQNALVGGDLESAAVGSELRMAIEAAAPVYRRYFWPADDRANRAWIAATAERMKSIAPDTIARLERFYGARWFSSPVRADVVRVANRQGAYTTVGPPPHATIACGEVSQVTWADVEIVFHEFSHVLILPIEARIARALGERLRANRELWHVVQFYLTGAAVQQVLKSRGIEYKPFMYASGLFDRAWSMYRKPVEANWEPYVNGKVGLDDAIAGTVAMIDSAR